ncbi:MULTISPECIES: ABC transporter permease subunit [Salinibaculum]|uniref:ABC transporter permease subunit n=1 Tax=Salinibaculum TaxID=2732368 RepID=UPI0030CF35DE
MTRYRYLVDVAQREFLTVVRTPMLVVLAAGYVALLVGISWLSASGAYLGLVLDLLTPVEVLVPVLAFAFGYRSLLGDRESGELETIRTYPIRSGVYVLGVFLGRAVVVLGVVLVGLFGSAALVPLGRGRQLTVIASHATVDSPALYFRFVVLTALFALAVLAVAVLVSATARSTRGGLALATGAVVMLVVGLDSSLVAGLTSGVVSPGGLDALLALSPNSAYRSLVFGVSLGPAGVSVPPGPAALASTVGLLAWLAAALVLAGVVAWR